jgi:hypothetical protein
MSVYDILYTLQELRQKTYLNIPDGSTLLKQNPHLVEPAALIPVILALFDDMLQTKEVRKELDRFKEEGVEIRKNYYSKMKEERERWTKIRTTMLEEKKQPPPDFDLTKWKRKVRVAWRFEHPEANQSYSSSITPKQNMIPSRVPSNSNIPKLRAAFPSGSRLSPTKMEGSTTSIHLLSANHPQSPPETSF